MNRAKYPPFRVILGILSLVGILYLYRHYTSEGFKVSKKFVYCFICHRESDALILLQRYPNCYILFVGPNDIKTNSRIYRIRDLPDNIEEERNLLTFTAWYAVSKNKLFEDVDYIGLFEYDVILHKQFEKRIKTEMDTKDWDVITFNTNTFQFLYDISYKVLSTFLKGKGISTIYSSDTKWYCSTNHIVKRSLLDDFVNWYYPDCLQLKELDKKQLPYYHERLFSVYIKETNKATKVIEGILEHIQQYSHRGGYKM